MDIEDTEIPGCYVLQAKVLEDQRGSFVKTFHAPHFKALGLRTDWREEYFTVSSKNVIRGMHFQSPPEDHAKAVFCLTGEVLDVVVDLRRGSPTFALALSFTLSGENGRGLYLPTGCAHGFMSVSDTSGMYYKVTSAYSPDHDSGISWDSIGFDWGAHEPILSDRDRKHQSMADFDSPFEFSET